MWQITVIKHRYRFCSSFASQNAVQMKIPITDDNTFVIFPSAQVIRMFKTLFTTISCLNLVLLPDIWMDKANEHFTNRCSVDVFYFLLLLRFWVYHCYQYCHSSLSKQSRSSEINFFRQLHIKNRGLKITQGSSYKLQLWLQPIDSVGKTTLISDCYQIPAIYFLEEHTTKHTAEASMCHCKCVNKKNLRQNVVICSRKKKINRICHKKYKAAIVK